MNLKKFMNVEQLEDWERRDEARHIFKMLNQKASDYHYSKLIERLYFYLDLDFVKEGLIKLYRTTKSDLLRDLIRSMHDGSLDLMNEDDAELESLNELNAYAQELDREYENELDSSENEALDSVFLKARLKKI